MPFIMSITIAAILNTIFFSFILSIITFPPHLSVHISEIEQHLSFDLFCFDCAEVSGIFQHLPYAPAKSFHWIADEQEYVQTCGFLTAARLLMKKGDMTERASGELLDQAICAVHSDSYHIRNAALLVIRKYMQHSEEHAFQVCRLVEGMADSTLEGEQMLYNMVKEELAVD